MITAFTGTPGAGKTAAMVDFLSRIAGDRPIFVAGIRKRDGTLEPTLDGLVLPHTVIEGEKWHEEVPDGAILVIDEAQKVWRPRGAAAKVPDHVMALEEHRHQGIDILFTTQGPKLIDSNVRDLVGRHVHIRDTGWFGRYWYEWPEMTTAPSWKNCPNKKRYRLPKKIFHLYKSSSLHVEPVRGMPKLVYVLVGLFVIGGYLALKVSGSVQKNLNGGKPVSGQATASASASASASSAPAGQSRGRAGDGKAPEPADFVPRVPGQAWTAPAYDHLRLVVSMPTITGAVCVNYECQCYHRKQRLYEVDATACLNWVHKRPFNPYEADEADEKSAERKTSTPSETRAAPVQSADATTGGVGHASGLGAATTSPL